LTVIVTLTEETSSKAYAWNPSLTAQRMENLIVRLPETKVPTEPAAMEQFAANRSILTS